MEKKNRKQDEGQRFLRKRVTRWNLFQDETPENSEQDGFVREDY